MKTVSFRKRLNAVGTITIYCRVTVAGQRCDFSTNTVCSPEQWENRHTGHVAKKMLLVQQTIRQLFERFPLLTAKEIVQQYQAGGQITVKRLLQKFLQTVEARQRVTQSTLTSYRSRINCALRFWPGSLPAAEVSLKLGEDVFSSMRRAGLGANYSNKTTRLVKQAFGWAVVQGLLCSNPLQYFDYEPVSSKITFLEESEIARIEAASFASKALQRTRDFFLFQCRTGLAFAELQAVGLSNVVQRNGQNWLYGARTKSQIEYFVPVEAVDLQHLRQYAGKSYVLQYYNRMLKEIAKITNIDKNLTSHVARRTAGMRWLDMGYSIEAVSRMLGHSDIKTTQRWYAKVRPTRVIRETAEIRNRIKKPSGSPGGFCFRDNQSI